MEEYMPFYQEPDIPHSDLVSFLQERALNVRDPRRSVTTSPNILAEKKVYKHNSDRFPPTKKEVKLTHHVSADTTSWDKIIGFIASIIFISIALVHTVVKYIKKEFAGYKKE